jgi:hypothetical protein
MFFLLFFLSWFAYQPKQLSLLSVGMAEADSAGLTNPFAYMFLGHWVWYAECKSADMASALKMSKSGVHHFIPGHTPF